MKILVTGGTGFIGNHMVRALLARGHECVLLDLLPPELPGHAFMQGDVRSPAAVAHAIRGCGAVLHLAAAHHDFGLSAETYRSVNVGGTRVIVEAAAREGIRSIAFLSTAAVYGHTAGARSEQTPPAPVTPYGVTKLEAEAVLSAWASATGDRSLVIFRPTVVFGPENFANMHTLIRQIDRGRFVFVGAGENRKSLAYVGNLVSALIARWPLPLEPGAWLYNYADLPDLTSRAIALLIYRALGRPAPGWSLPMPLARLFALPFDLATALTGRDFGLSSARLRKFAEAETMLVPGALQDEGYRPLHTLEEGIAEMVCWHQSAASRGLVAPRLPPETVLPWNPAC